MSLHGKSYGTKEEYALRFDIFRKNMEDIRRENADPKNTFQMGMNKFGDWTVDERKKILSYRPNREMRNAVRMEYDENKNVSIPTAIDWRNLGAVNPVRD